MAEDIRRIPLHQRTEVLSPAALPEQRKKSPPTCSSHIIQPTIPQPPPPAPTVQALTLVSTFLCWLCGNHGHVGTDCPEKQHTTNSLRYCINCQETGSTPQPLINLNAIQCHVCFGHPYGSQCNKKKESTSVAYSNRTKKAIRTCYNLSPMPESSNQPDLHVAQWLYDTTTLNDYHTEIGNVGSWEHLYFKLLDGHSVQDAKLIDGFLYIYKGYTWPLMIPGGLEIKGMSAQHCFIQQAHDNTGHGGLDKTYQNLTDKYHWKDSSSDVKKFVESCDICLAT